MSARQLSEIGVSVRLTIAGDPAREVANPGELGLDAAPPIRHGVRSPT